MSGALLNKRSSRSSQLVAFVLVIVIAACPLILLTSAAENKNLPAGRGVAAVYNFLQALRDIEEENPTLEEKKSKLEWIGLLVEKIENNSFKEWLSSMKGVEGRICYNVHRITALPIGEDSSFVVPPAFQSEEASNWPKFSAGKIGETWINKDKIRSILIPMNLAEAVSCLLSFKGKDNDDDNDNDNNDDNTHTVKYEVTLRSGIRGAQTVEEYAVTRVHKWEDSTLQILYEDAKKLVIQLSFEEPLLRFRELKKSDVPASAKNIMDGPPPSSANSENRHQQRSAAASEVPEQHFKPPFYGGFGFF